MTCNKCSKLNQKNSNFCSNCGSDLREQAVAEAYKNPYGLWEVTTEGDCEGRTITHLGTYEGFIDEIARKLGHKCYYSLHFKHVPVDKNEEINRANKVKNVSISLDIKSNTWGMGNTERAAALAKTLFATRPVKVKEGHYYASVVLEFDNDKNS